MQEVADWTLCVGGWRPTGISSSGFPAFLFLTIDHQPLKFPTPITRIVSLLDQVLNVCHQTFIVHKAEVRKGR